MSFGERWLRDRLSAPLPRVDPLVHLPEAEDIPSTLAQDAERIRELVETGQSGQFGSWQIRMSADGVELTSTSLPEIRAEVFRALVHGNVYIPEPVLVALAAIEEYAPEWIRNEYQFRSKVVEPSTASGEAKPDTLARTLEEHGRHWKNWHNLEQYRRAYLELCSELRRGE